MDDINFRANQARFLNNLQDAILETIRKGVRMHLISYDFAIKVLKDYPLIVKLYSEVVINKLKDDIVERQLNGDVDDTIDELTESEDL